MSTLTQREEQVIATFADNISALLDHHTNTSNALDFARGAMEWCEQHHYPTAADIFLEDVCYLEQLTP